MSKTFFEDIQGVSSFPEACNSEKYYPVPDDWYVVVTDVVGSTQAIQAGRYKDVNMLGAACITVVANVCEDIKIPYVFGGDGATFLIPEECIEAVKNELMGVRRLAGAMHGLSLRVGVVPITEIVKHKKTVTVGKYLMPTGFPLAMFGGGGVALADCLVKEGGFELDDKDFQGHEEPDLSDLSCRWQPIKSQKGNILTILVMAENNAEEQAVYSEINQFIEQTLGQDSSPVKEEALVYKWPTVSALRDAKIVWQHGNKVLKIFNHVVLITVFNILNRFNLKIGSLDVESYRDDMIQSSDYRKFDDMLRMVIDCSIEQIEAIKTFLDKLHSQGKIVYGTHESDSALMTCFVSSLEALGHVHFIDGNNGGYAIAAKQLKEQVLSQKSNASIAV